MDNYLNSFREMISLRGLTDHTLKITAPGPMSIFSTS